MVHYRIFFDVLGTSQPFPPVPADTIHAIGMEDYAKGEVRRMRRLGRTCTLEKFDASVRCWVPCKV